MGFVTLLFALSEKGLHRDNSFIRRFPGHPAIKTHELDLTYDSYYIAGAADGQIYLGNASVPLNLWVLDTALQKKQTIRLRLDRDSIPNRAPQLRVIPPHFFLMDGTIPVPYIFRGNTTNWKARSILEEPLYFSRAQPMDSLTLAIKAMSSKTKEHVLGKISLADTAKMALSHELLQKQVDGVFDTDGLLHYNHQLQKLVYTYFYRNQYIVANNDLSLNLLGKTIDTISRAQVKVATIASKNQRQLAAPALMVNKSSATYGNYLFVNSQLPGRYESLEVWEQASIIDVYNLVENTYEFSFYVYDIGKEKLNEFKVLDDKFIGLIGNHIVTYQLSRDRFKDMYDHHTTAMDSPKIENTVNSR
ncbi:MAG: hypothetical protein COB01_11480 [Lutibacter sp.]|nr:MAG: hypothetical protein COB01_11480 [Lutibacter sp.]